MPAAIMNKMGSDSTRNEHVETRVCLINFDGSSVKVTLFSSLKIMRVGRIFTRGEIVDFFQGVQKWCNFILLPPNQENHLLWWKFNGKMSNLELQTEAKTPLVPSSCTHAKDVSILECLIFTQITHFNIFQNGIISTTLSEMSKDERLNSWTRTSYSSPKIPAVGHSSNSNKCNFVLALATPISNAELPLQLRV